MMGLVVGSAVGKDNDGTAVGAACPTGRLQPVMISMATSISAGSQCLWNVSVFFFMLAPWNVINKEYQ
jgi:hypothetical protein